MAYSYDRRFVAHKPRFKQRGKKKIKSKRYYRKRRQSIKQRSKQWRRRNKSKIKRYERRRKAQPQLYRLRPARKASEEHPLFNPIEDLSLIQDEIEFWDPSTDTPDVGFVDWIDLDRGEVHTIFVREEGSRFNKTYDLYDWMEVATLMFEEDEAVLLEALDDLHADAEEGED